MYTIVVEGSFRAVHRVTLSNGTVEDPHPHDWGVRACFASRTLDRVGMVMDFQHARRELQEVLDQLDQTDLNKIEQLKGLNPTAEVVAGQLFERLWAKGLRTLRRIEVTEEPGCVAAFECPPDADAAGSTAGMSDPPPVD